MGRGVFFCRTVARSNGGRFRRHTVERRHGRTADRRGRFRHTVATVATGEPLTGRTLPARSMVAAFASGLKRACKGAARRDGRESVRRGRTQRRAFTPRFRRWWRTGGESEAGAACDRSKADGADGCRNRHGTGGRIRRGVPMFAGIADRPEAGAAHSRHGLPESGGAVERRTACPLTGG